MPTSPPELRPAAEAGAPPAHPGPIRVPGRDTALDGLRGVAALLVVAHHLVLATVPRLADAYAGAPAPDGLAHAVTASPLHVLWDGPACVAVFFVLSGYVLSLAASGGAPFRAAAYYPNRLVRLYVPVWGAVGFALLTRWVVERRPVPGATFWLDAHAAPVTTDSLVAALSLTRAIDLSVNSVLWSLRWEVAFSLLLPLALWLARRRPDLRGPLALAALVVIAVWGEDHESARYLPVFLLGVLLAFERDAISRLADALRGRPLTVAALGLFAVVLLELPWLGATSGAMAYAGTALGAALVLVVVLVSPGLQRVLSSRAGVAVGRRSYSLYLVHEPVVVAVCFALGTSETLPLAAVIALPCIAVATVAFHALVERPSHRLARRAGGLAARARARAAT